MYKISGIIKPIDVKTGLVNFRLEIPEVVYRDKSIFNEKNPDFSV